MGSVSSAINETDTAKFNEVFTRGAKIKFNFNCWVEPMTGYPFLTKKWPRASTVLFLGDRQRWFEGAERLMDWPSVGAGYRAARWWTSLASISRMRPSRRMRSSLRSALRILGLGTRRDCAAVFKFQSSQSGSSIHRMLVLPPCTSPWYHMGRVVLHSLRRSCG